MEVHRREVAAVFTDVTSQKQAELPVRRLAELVDTAEDAIIGQTVDGLIVDWNRGAERLYGYRCW